MGVITTTYTGATEARAVETLAALPGVELRISLDGRRSRLHAKAWLFHRATGFGTAFVGSANLSAVALLGGVEWTVKFTQAGQADLFAAAEAHFETLWNDPEFQRFDPNDEVHRQKLRHALQQAEGTNSEPIATPIWFDLQPKGYQQAMLDRLGAERRHGRTRNLVVAATGTGKTVVAAFDYKCLCGKRRALPDTPLGQLKIEIERTKARIRAKAEHPFHVLKNRFGMKKLRYRGLAKNTAQLYTMFGLANLYIAERELFALHAEGAS